MGQALSPGIGLRGNLAQVIVRQESRFGDGQHRAPAKLDLANARREINQRRKAELY